MVVRAIVAVVLALASLLVRAGAQTVSDQDSLCAAVYIFLAGNAHDSGMSGDSFQSAADVAQNYHMSAYPTDDPQRYALSVIDSAQTLRDSFFRGYLDNSAIIAAATSCNLRYFSAGQQ